MCGGRGGILIVRRGMRDAELVCVLLLFALEDRFVVRIVGELVLFETGEVFDVWEMEGEEAWFV